MALCAAAVWMLTRRQILERDPPTDFRALLAAIRAHGYTTSDITFVLNVPRSTLWSWERPSGNSEPGYEDGRAIFKFHASLSEIPPPEDCV